MLNYIRPTWEGKDGKPSIRRILGISCITIGIILSVLAFFGDCNCIANKVLIIGGLFTAGLGFFGITTTSDYYYDKNVNYPSLYGGDDFPKYGKNG